MLPPANQMTSFEVPLLRRTLMIGRHFPLWDDSLKDLFSTRSDTAEPNSFDLGWILDQI